MSLGNFNKALRDAERRVVHEATEAMRGLGQELYASLVQRAADVNDGTGSPVASGRFAASMRLDINKIDTSTAPRDPSYRYPSPKVHRYNANNLPARTRRNVAASRVAAKLRTFRLGDTIFISNSVPYARRIENTGHSWQAPQGVFEATTRAVAKRFRFARLRGVQCLILSR